MIVTLNVHYSRGSDLLVPDTMITSPFIPYVSSRVASYRDSFGNWVQPHRRPSRMIRDPRGAVINDSGQPDEAGRHMAQHAVEGLPLPVVGHQPWYDNSHLDAGFQTPCSRWPICRGPGLTIGRRRDGGSTRIRHPAVRP